MYVRGKSGERTMQRGGPYFQCQGIFHLFFFVGLRNLTLISVVPHAVVKINGLPSCIKSDSRFAVFVFLLLFFLCELSEVLFTCPLLWFAKNNTRTLEK